MTVSPVEIVDDAHGGTLPTSSSIAFTETPAAGDVLVVFVSAYHALTVSNMSGCGATWAQAHAVNTTNFRQSHIVWIGVGATSAGTVTVTTNATSNGAIRGFMVRGLASATVTDAATTEGAVSSLNGPAHTAVSGQFALAGAGSAGTGTMTFPSTVTPSGWTTQTERTLGPYPFNTTYRAPSSSATHQVEMSYSVARQLRVTQIVIGSAVDPPIVVTGATASITVAAHVGTAVSPVVVAGLAASITVAGHAGSFVAPPVVIGGTTASITVAAYAGTPAIPAVVTGTTVTVVVTAYTGSTGGIDVTGSTANMVVEGSENQTNFYAVVVDTFTRGNGRTRVAISHTTVTYAPATPPRPQQPVRIMAQQLPEPTLVDGKPT